MPPSIHFVVLVLLKNLTKCSFSSFLNIFCYCICTFIFWYVQSKTPHKKNNKNNNNETHRECAIFSLSLHISFKLLKHEMNAASSYNNIRIFEIRLVCIHITVFIVMKLIFCLSSFWYSRIVFLFIELKKTVQFFFAFYISWAQYNIYKQKYSNGVQ